MGTVHKLKGLQGGGSKKPRKSPREQQQADLLEQSLTGFSNRLINMRCRQPKIDRVLSHVKEFREHSGKYPWNWLTDDFEAWGAHLAVDLGNGTGTQRQKQLSIKQYTEYLKESKYAVIIEKEFGITLKPICTVDNMILHKVERDNKSPRRNFTRTELMQFFAGMDELIKIYYHNHSKGLLPAQRDKALYALFAKLGLRSDEMVHINIDDFSANPDHSDFGNFGRVEVWFGKSTQGSEKKHRTVWITDMETVDILKWYVPKIRPKFIGRKTKDEDFRALFFSERGNRISQRSIEANLKTYLNCFNMPTEGLVPHSLRHSYVTNEQEDNDVSAHFIQKQAGHEFLSTTQQYTHFSDDYYRKLLNDTIEKKLKKRRQRENNEKDPVEG